MIPDHSYSDFKRKLCANPRWIYRGLVVLAHSPEIATPKNIDEILAYIKAIESNGFVVCPPGVDITTTKPSLIVRQHAPDIYRFYRKQFEVPETTS